MLLETTPEPGVGSPPAAASVAMLADLVETLLPGDETWPSGRTVGIQAQLALRLIEKRGRDALPKLVAALVAAGARPDASSEEARVAAVARFEAAEPALFGWVRDAASVAYDENPFVVEVIKGLSFVYDLRPHVRGYPVPRFDLARDTPRHGRGRYLRIDDVRRVDVSGLDPASERTQAVDGSVLATGGVVNPTPTISALALCAAGYIRGNLGTLSAATRSLAA